jgi:hypothetical protein
LRAFNAHINPSPQKNLHSSLGRKNEKILTDSGAIAILEGHIRQEASMKRWVGMCAAALTGVATPAAASTVNLQYEESIGYTLDYFSAPWHLYIAEEWDGDAPKFRAHVSPDRDGYEKFAQIYFQIIVQGPTRLGSLSDLAGKTLDFGKLDRGFGHPVDYVEWWQESDYCWVGEWDECPSLEGKISFDSLGAVSDYEVGFSRGMANVYTSLSSSPSAVEVWDRELWNPEAIEGLYAFGTIYFEEGPSSHSLRPGYWQVGVQKDCWLVDGNGDYVDDVECRSAAPTPIPLPTSWGFLLIAVGSLAGMRAVRNARSA